MAPDQVFGKPFASRILRLNEQGEYMHLFRETFLLFSLNLLDAILTIVWVRNGVATESNQIMAKLLDSGDFTFLAAKIAMGTIAALVILRWSDVKMARYGLTVALAVYISLMGIHVVTGLSAFGIISRAGMQDLASLANGLIAFVM
jgi:hypothetical protein